MIPEGPTVRSIDPDGGAVSARDLGADACEITPFSPLQRKCDGAPRRMSRL